MVEKIKYYIQKKLASYVRKYLKKHPDVKLIVVAGSVGKTGTKHMVATLLSQKYRVRMQKENYNSELSSPCGILGIEYPSEIKSILQWHRVFKAARKRIKQKTDIDIIIQEIATDHPGDMAEFSKYITPDLAIVTAVAPEHMEFFGTMEKVAEEELSVVNFSKTALLNVEDIDARFLHLVDGLNYSTYSIGLPAEYSVKQLNFKANGYYSGRMVSPEFPDGFDIKVKVLGEHSLMPVIGAIATAIKFGMTPQEIRAGLALIEPVPGRMNLLKGTNGTQVIDDTYNSSPAAAEAALKVLYEFRDGASQRIAILGDMRELGKTSAKEHRKLGKMCDGNKLDYVVLVGEECAKYLAPEARKNGCRVEICKNAIEAGEFVRSVAKKGAVILVKGSQNTIFLEEAVKILVDMKKDVELVRQGPKWQKIKDRHFGLNK